MAVVGPKAVPLGVAVPPPADTEAGGYRAPLELWREPGRQQQRMGAERGPQALQAQARGEVKHLAVRQAVRVTQWQRQITRYDEAGGTVRTAGTGRAVYALCMRGPSAALTRSNPGSPRRCLTDTRPPHLVLLCEEHLLRTPAAGEQLQLRVAQQLEGEGRAVIAVEL